MKRERVAIIGDVILDEIVELRKGSMSAEGLVTYHEVSRQVQSGGAANVAKHLARLGARVCLIHGGEALPFGDDGLTGWEALQICQLFTGRGSVVTKRRYYCDGQKVMKVNGIRGRGERVPAVELVERALRDGPWEVIVACDNGHGTLTGQEQELVQLCKIRGRELIVDAQLSQTNPNFGAWRGADEIVLNSDEFHAIGTDLGGFCRYHVKLGQDGSNFWDGSHFQRQWGFPVDVVDTVGAGDAYLAAWVRSGDLRLANLWAALSCTMIGTGLPSAKDLHDEAFA